jgi:hypothetical protein
MSRRPRRADRAEPGEARNNGSRCAGGHRDDRNRAGERRSTCGKAPIEDLRVSMVVEQAEPGSAQDDRLRQEQARAVFDLLAAWRDRNGKTPG